MNWLRNKINEHNKKLSYIDYEEYWTFGDYITSCIFHIIILPLISIEIGIYNGVWGCALIGGFYSILMLVWHIWHLIFY